MDTLPAQRSSILREHARLCRATPNPSSRHIQVMPATFTRVSREATPSVSRTPRTTTKEIFAPTATIYGVALNTSSLTPMATC